MADELRETLKRWGHATVARFAVIHDGPSAGDHILARNKDLAPGTRENAERALLGRSGVDRRRRMASGLRDAGVNVVPMWACDAIPARNDADAPHDRLPVAAIDIGLPDELRWVESAIAALSRVYPLRAMVLREEFTGTGTQRMKADRIQGRYGGKFNVNQYRVELRKALDWMDMKRAA